MKVKTISKEGDITSGERSLQSAVIRALAKNESIEISYIFTNDRSLVFGKYTNAGATGRVTKESGCYNIHIAGTPQEAADLFDSILALTIEPEMVYYETNEPVFKKTEVAKTPAKGLSGSSASVRNRYGLTRPQRER